MPRKKDNEIYTYKLKSGKVRYGFKTYIGKNEENGKSVKVTRQGFSTRKEAEQEKYRLKVAGGTAVANEHQEFQENKTVQNTWKAFHESQKLVVRPSTLLRNNTMYKKIKAEFGDAYINKIDPDHLQNWINELAKNYVEFKPIVNLLHRLIKLALLKGWATDDPFNRVIIPKKGKKSNHDSKDNYYEEDELKAFLNAAKKVNPKIYAFMFTSASLGLRRGETFALKWTDIDFDQKTIYISRTVSTTEDGKKIIGPTKTNDKYRRIDGLPMSDKLVDVLKNYRENFSNAESDFIFCNRSGDYYNTSITNSWLDKIYKENPDLKRITTHGLRHTLASLLFESDQTINPQEVQYMLGHSDVKTTLDIYTTVTKKRKDRLKRSVNSLKI